MSLDVCCSNSRCSRSQAWCQEIGGNISIPYLLAPMMKISVIIDISVLRFYGYIGDILADILEKNIGTFKIVKNS